MTQKGELLATLVEQCRQVAAASFDPWTATEAEARAGTAFEGYFCESLPLMLDMLDPRSPLAQWLAAQRLTEFKDGIAAGRGSDVLFAVALCAKHGLVMPEWLSALFLRRHRAVTEMRCKSWSDPEAFGDPWHGYSLEHERKRAGQRLEVAALFQHYCATVEGSSKTRFIELMKFRKSLPLPDEAADDMGLGRALAARVRRLDLSKGTVDALLKEEIQSRGELRRLAAKEVEYLNQTPELSAWAALKKLHGIA